MSIFTKEYLVKTMRNHTLFAFSVTCLLPVSGSAKSADYFRKIALPALDKYCIDCHDPEDSEGGILFLEAEKPMDMEKRRAEFKGR